MTQHLFNPRPSDDPVYRLRVYARNRARRNGGDEAKAEALAEELYWQDTSRSLETIITEAAGSYRMGAVAFPRSRE